MYTPQGDPVKPSQKIVLPSFHVFPSPFLDPKRSPVQNVGPRDPHLAPGQKRKKKKKGDDFDNDNEHGHNISNEHDETMMMMRNEGL